MKSNRDVILTDFDEHMHQVFGSRTRVPCCRNVRSNQMDDFDYSQRINLQTSEGYWYRKEFGNLCRVNVEIHEDALDREADCQ